MAHPYHEHRSHKVEKRRAHRIAGGRMHYASGGGVHKEDDAHIAGEEDDSFETDRGVASDHIHKRQRHLQSSHPSRKHGGEVHGKASKHRLDRHHRKKGGRTSAYTEASEHKALKAIKALEKHEKDEIAYEREHRAFGGRNKSKKGGKHVTNVIVAPQGGHDRPMPVPVPAGGPPQMGAPPPRPPMPPPGGPPGMPPGAPPGLAGLAGGMPRKRGGRVSHDLGPGKVESEKHKTPVQHTDGKTDGANIGRGKPITYNRGGKVSGVSVPIAPIGRVKHDPVSRSVPQLGKAKDTTSRAVKPIAAINRPHFHGGSKSGVGRLEKMASEKRHYP